MQAIRTIKKYPNRRLYDTGVGSYITLRDVKELVFQQINFEVIDAKTHKDITQNTLLQILADEESQSTPIFSVTILKNLIRFYHEQLHGILSQYLQETLQIFINKKEFLQKNWECSSSLLNRIVLQHLMDELEAE